MENMNEVLSKLDDILGNVDLKDVTAESTGFEELPDGYYLCEVEKAELTVSKASQNPMVAMQYKVVDDGYDIDETNPDALKINAHTKNRKIFIYSVLKDEKSVKRFATDMLKFEGEVEGESLLPKEAFMTSETLEDALDVLVGMRIYIMVSTTVNDDGTKRTWNNLISWKKVDRLGLPK